MSTEVVAGRRTWRGVPYEACWAAEFPAGIDKRLNGPPVRLYQEVFGTEIVPGSQAVEDLALLAAGAHQALETLPLGQRIVVSFRLGFGDGRERSFIELATFFGASPGTLHPAYQRAIDLLREEPRVRLLLMHLRLTPAVQGEAADA